MDPLAVWVGFAGLLLTATSGILGAKIAARTERATAAHQARQAAESQKVTAENSLIDQLQEELTRYRDATDKRLDRLEAENRGYRAFIGVQRDHMAAHGVPLPDWPEGLPR